MPARIADSTLSFMQEKKEAIDAEVEFVEDQIMHISIRTSDYSFYGALKNENIDGINVVICFTDSVPELPPEHLHYAIIAATPVSMKLLAKWLSNKFKDKPGENILINGNQINFQTMSISEITNVIRGEKEGEQGHRETD